MKYIPTTISLIIITFSFLHCQTINNQLDFTEESHIINFKWESDTLGNQFKEKVAISVPFSIDEIPHNFYSQFDLGSDVTMIYGNSIAPYLELYPGLKHKLKINDEVSIFQNVDFSVGEYRIQGEDLYYMADFGDEYTLSEIENVNVKNIGTVGANIFQGKYLIINFPKQKIIISTDMSLKDIEHFEFVDMIIDQGRIKIPVQINEQIDYFMFDTGSSLFPLIVTQNNWDRFEIDKSVTDTLNVSSWGEYYDVYGNTINSKISIGNLKIETENKMLYLNPKEEFEQFFMQENITGIIGNSFFLDRRIIIDFKSRRFGVERLAKNVSNY